MRRTSALAVSILALCVAQAPASTPASRRGVMQDASAEIAFIHRGSVDAIRVVDSRGRGSRMLMEDKGSVEWVIGEGHRSGLAWALDGKRLLLSSTSGTRTVDKGGQVLHVPYDRCDNGQVSWSPDQRRIVCGFGDGIVIVGAGARSLFEDTGSGDSSKYEPAWSPDGRSIAYIEGIVGGNLRIYDFSTRRSRSLDSTSGGSLVHAPAWSADGRWIAFSNHCFSG
jgi:WD40 repeat protein